VFRWLHTQAHHRGLHGRAHVDRERTIALAMILTGLARVVLWTIITLAFVVRIPVVVHWFGSVAFVSLLSILALLLTDWGQVAASLAQFTAGHAHADIETTRREVQIDTVQIERDIAQLARIEPGPEGDELADAICRRLHG
jgi:hypothetical protein